MHVQQSSQSVLRLQTSLPTAQSLSKGPVEWIPWPNPQSHLAHLSPLAALTKSKWVAPTLLLVQAKAFNSLLCQLLELIDILGLFEIFNLHSLSMS